MLYLIKGVSQKFTVYCTCFTINNKFYYNLPTEDYLIKHLNSSYLIDILAFSDYDETVSHLVNIVESKVKCVDSANYLDYCYTGTKLPVYVDGEEIQVLPSYFDFDIVEIDRISQLIKLVGLSATLKLKTKLFNVWWW